MGWGHPVVVPGLPQNIRILPAEHLLKRGVWGVEGAGRDPQFLAKKSKFVQTSAEPRGGMDTRCVAHVVFCCPPPASWQTPANTTKLRHTSTAVRGRHLKQIFMADRGSKINRELNQTLLERGEEEAEEKIGEPLQSLGSALNFSPGAFFFQEKLFRLLDDGYKRAQETTPWIQADPGKNESEGAQTCLSLFKRVTNLCKFPPPCLISFSNLLKWGHGGVIHPTLIPSFPKIPI